MKATSIRPFKGFSIWDAEQSHRHSDASIVKVLCSPGQIGSMTFLVIDSDGYLVKGTAANYHDIEGIISILYRCKNLYDAAQEMQERHYRLIAFVNPELENAA